MPNRMPGWAGYQSYYRGLAQGGGRPGMTNPPNRQPFTPPPQGNQMRGGFNAMSLPTDPGPGGGDLLGTDPGYVSTPRGAWQNVGNVEPGDLPGNTSGPGYVSNPPPNLPIPIPMPYWDETDWSSFPPAERPSPTERDFTPGTDNRFFDWRTPWTPRGEITRYGTGPGTQATWWGPSEFGDLGQVGRPVDINGNPVDPRTGRPVTAWNSGGNLTFGAMGLGGSSSPFPGGVYSFPGSGLRRSGGAPGTGIAANPASRFMHGLGSSLGEGTTGLANPFHGFSGGASLTGEGLEGSTGFGSYAWNPASGQPPPDWVVRQTEKGKAKVNSLGTYNRHGQGWSFRNQQIRGGVKTVGGAPVVAKWAGGDQFNPYER